MGRGRTAITVVIGGTTENAMAAFLDAFERAERGEEVEPQRVLSFESWAAYHRNGLAEIAALLAQVEAEETAQGDPSSC